MVMMMTMMLLLLLRMMMTPDGNTLKVQTLNVHHRQTLAPECQPKGPSQEYRQWWRHFPDIMWPDPSAALKYGLEQDTNRPLADRPQIDESLTETKLQIDHR